MPDYNTADITSREDYDSNPRGQYEYWSDELQASRKRLKTWHKQAGRIVRRYIDYRNDTEFVDVRSEGQAFRLNLFHSNITTLQSMLYGNLPTVDVSRRYADPNDDVSRVAGEILERLLNNDIEDNGEDYNSVLRACLQDRLLPGLGCARARYEVETEEAEVQVQKINPETGEIENLTITEERVIFEDAPVDYFHWRDVCWGWSRTWKDLPWIAFRAWMTKDEVTERWGKEVAEELTYKKQMVSTTNKDEYDSMDSPDQGSVWNKAQVWEVWDKVERKVVFISLGYPKVIESRDDPLELGGFYPTPPLFLANQTTSLYQPTPDFHLSQDLYNEIDRLQTRIAIITEAVKVVGLYNSECDQSIARMFKEGTDNMLIPVKSWDLFGEKGGIGGAVDWLPINDIVSSLDKLRELRDETIQLLYQVTGMSDVMRGAGGQYEGTGQAAIKAKFASVRVQALQDEFANFASGIMAIKAEIICRHFEPRTIVERANIENTYDRDLAPQAVQLLKDYQTARMRVKIRPESVAMVDYADLKAERTEYINALAVFLQSSKPLMELDPTMKPFLFQLMQWGMSGFKGSSEIEGVIDKAIDQAKKQAMKPKPDPQMAAQQAQAQGQLQLEKMKQSGEILKIQAKGKADANLRVLDHKADIQQIHETHTAKMREIEAELFASTAETQAEMQADITVEQVQAATNIEQTNASARAEIQKDVVSHKLDIDRVKETTRSKIDEISAAAIGKISEEHTKQQTEQIKLEGNEDAAE